MVRPSFISTFSKLINEAIEINNQVAQEEGYNVRSVIKKIEEDAERIEKLEKKVEHISQIKWMTVGCGVILAILATAVSSLASGLWVPSGMQPNSINQNQSLTQFKINARI